MFFQMVRVLVQNCVKANQVLYCEGKPVLTTAGHVRANNFAVSFHSGTCDWPHHRQARATQ